MKPTTSTTGNIRKRMRAVILIVGVAAAYACTPPIESSTAEEAMLLSGRVTSSGGEALVEIPVKAHRESSNVTVVVYTDNTGAYAFPSWSDLVPGSHTVSIELPDFEHTALVGVALSEGQTARMDFTLQSRQPSLSDATASEIIAALSGTDDQKVLLAQCSNCHSLQWALNTAHTKEEWVELIRLMAGERRASGYFPGTRSYGQQRFIEPLAEYLASIRGPGSSDAIPFQLRPRPTDEASTRLVMTEYDLPRGGQRELYMLRGDRRFVWPHDVIVDDNYAWYTDHFSSVLGRLDRKTGKAVELTYPTPPGGGRDMEIPAGQERLGNPGLGGSHDLFFDAQGNGVFGMDEATVRYNPRTDEFVHWTSGNNMFGLDSEGHVWHTDDGGPLFEIDTATGEITEHPIPTNDGVYDMDTDSQGRTLINIWRNAKIGMFNPETKAYSEFPTPTPESGPRRGEIDAQDRLWVALYYAGRVARFDPNTGEIKEFPLIPGTEAFAPPHTAPYSTAVDNEHQFVWTTDFYSNRIFRIDMNTEEVTEYFMPGPYEVRDLTVESGTDRPTFWIPSYRPPSKIVKVQIR